MGYGAGMAMYHMDGLGTMDSGHYSEMGWHHVVIFPLRPLKVIQEAINMLPTHDGKKLPKGKYYKLDGFVNDQNEGEEVSAQ